MQPTLRVDYSTINYKDALAITNKSPIVRKWPMVAGIDGAGVVEESTHPSWKPGDRVILNGWGVGEAHWGCLGQKARLRGLRASRRAPKRRTNTHRAQLRGHGEAAKTF